MKYTTNLNLKKPDYTDPVDIQDINSNMDTIDSAIQSKANSSQVLTNVPANAKFTDTTYTEITTAEIDTGTSSALRTITARRLKYLLDKIVSMFPSKTSDLNNDSGFLTSVSKTDVGLGNVDNTSDLNKPISTATQTALDTKVDNSRVLTDVPLNAKFTDTITTINSKTGVITKADIVALGIPSVDTNTITTINGKTGEITKADIVALGIPAQDTDTTYTEITTAEIDAGTASTLRTITARRVQYILDKVSNIISNAISALTKADIDLGNVDNTSDLDKPISIATQTALNSKVDNSRVLTNVPSGAKFTDTIYTHPSNHPASMITESTTKRFVSDTEKSSWSGKAEKSDIPTKVGQLENDSGYVTQGELGDAGFGNMMKEVYDTNNNGIVDNAEKVNGFTVGVNVPANAKFTDTVYSHPSTHPASMITGLPTSLPASGGHALSATHLLGDDTRAVNSAPSVYMSGGTRYASRAGWQTEFKTRTAINSPPLSGTYVYLQTYTPWSDPSGGYPIQVVYGNGTPCWRVGVSTSAWSAWQGVNDDGNASTVNGFTVGTNVPANAKFTDTNTITTINGKTGVIAKADVVALGIPAQDTVYSHPSSHPASIIVESATKRFVSDAEKTTWNNKANASDIPNKFVHVGTSQPTNNQMGWIDTSL